MSRGQTELFPDCICFSCCLSTLQLHPLCCCSLILKQNVLIVNCETLSEAIDYVEAVQQAHHSRSIDAANYAACTLVWHIHHVHYRICTLKWHGACMHTSLSIYTIRKVSRFDTLIFGYFSFIHFFHIIGQFR